MPKPYALHLAAINAGTVTRANVNGIRRLINASERKAAGWSIGVTASAVDLDALYALEEALDDKRPRVTGELHDSGLKVLRNRRYAKRLDGLADSIAAIDHFTLVRFDRIGRRGEHCVPVFAVWSRIPAKGDALDGGTYRAFTFRNVPWQSGGDGPELVSE